MTAETHPRIHTLEIPPRYWDDHRRACTSEDEPIVEEGSRGKVRVTLSERDLDELHSRALYTTVAEYQPPADWIGLKASARATVRAINRYWREHYDFFGERPA